MLHRVGVMIDEGASTAGLKRKASSSTAASSSSSSGATTTTARRSIAVVKRRKKPAAKRRKKRGGDDCVYADEVDSSEDEGDSKFALVSKQVQPEDEVIPGLRCPMTCEPMADPALSPYGHVMSYDTWLRVLKRKPTNTCPFTKQKLTRRMLIKITKENKHEHMDKIQHVQAS
jgi:hypothetical protein